MHQEEQAIRHTLSQLAEAWNRADGAAYGACFTADADYVDVTGQHTQGAEAIGRLHQWLFDGPLKGMQLDGSGAARVRLLTPEVAVVVSAGAGTRLGAQLPADRRSINTTVLLKTPEGWRIAAFQNSRMAPPRGPGH